MHGERELGLGDESLPRNTLEALSTIVKLLREVTSLLVVSEFLKAKGLTHSAGSWEEMHEKRLVPALSSKKITIQELARLLSEAEEFGRSHMFLYFARNRDVSRLMDQQQIRSVCQRLGCVKALDGTHVVDLPNEPTFTEIRLEEADGQKRCVFKIVEAREEKKYIGETQSGDIMRREWRLIPLRAVNVARLHSNGFLELRITAHINSTKYEDDLNRMWTLLMDFLPPTLFQEFSLSKAKTRLWEERGALRKKIRFSDSTMRNNFGTTLIASTGKEEADLFSDSGAKGSLDVFLGQGGGHCDSSNVWWQPVDGVITREVHTLLSGLNHEFAITANCTKLEYEYVLNELRVHSR